jgi:hypothetical protein
MIKSTRENVLAFPLSSTVRAPGRRQLHLSQYPIVPATQASLPFEFLPRVDRVGPLLTIAPRFITSANEYYVIYISFCAVKQVCYGVGLGFVF